MIFLYLIFYDLIAHDELRELSKAQAAIKVRPLFKFPPSYFSLAYTTAVNQACLFQTSFIPLSGKFDRSPKAELVSASFVEVSVKIRERDMDRLVPLFPQGRLQLQLRSYLLHLACQQASEDVYGSGAQLEMVSEGFKDMGGQELE